MCRSDSSLLWRRNTIQWTGLCNFFSTIITPPFSPMFTTSSSQPIDKISSALLVFVYKKVNISDAISAVKPLARAKCSIYSWFGSCTTPKCSPTIIFFYLFRFFCSYRFIFTSIKKMVQRWCTEQYFSNYADLFWLYN